MLQNYSRYRILQEFFDFPRKDFQMREIARRTRITQPSVMNHLQALQHEHFILKEKKGIYPAFRANRDEEPFRTHKKLNMLLRLQETGLLDDVYDACLPGVIVLFGSAARGEDTEESDIDLFVQAKEKRMDLSKYEKLLQRKINVFFKESFLRLNIELKNNIINGTVLRGYLKAF